MKYVRVTEESYIIDCPDFAKGCKGRSCPACIVVTVNGVAPEFRAPYWCGKYGKQLCEIWVDVTTEAP
jgi:hypothetical protein